MTVHPEHSSERRWTVFVCEVCSGQQDPGQDQLGAGAPVDCLACRRPRHFEAVEVMPVAEHRAVLSNIAHQLDRTGRVDWDTV